MIRRNKLEKVFDFGNYFLINSFRYVLEMRAIFGRDFLLYLVCRMNNKNCRGCLTFFWENDGGMVIPLFHYGRIFFYKKKSKQTQKRFSRQMKGRCFVAEKYTYNSKTTASTKTWKTLTVRGESRVIFYRITNYLGRRILSYIIKSEFSI